MQPPTHHTIVTGLHQRDPQIIGWLYTTYAPRLIGYFTRRLRDPDLARDLYHELFLRLLERAPTFTDRGVPIEAWLFRLAHDLVVDTHRRAGRSVPLTDAAHSAADDAVTLTCLHAADQAALYQAITTLPLTYRRVLTLRFRDNCSLADTALQLGLSLSATKALQRRAIACLRALLVTAPDDVPPSLPPYSPPMA
ncbi:RNA polymerase sigma factor [Chloroflexus aggregans]|uniref:RNA polymerase, sigma-24 subunit, ECF subfamily n=1 Tax=Chloroflexus aggregans (strain MD-66 / DSM 9485) TaxID=326427 RepID=B8GDC1_CHLAD|nr:sigma-70 family RNA polymerase sigma factor [Chloroflexus aggregans]ACL25188.1 RNA polymerase, sigma-24 subunit, ECF subfamily [Chloroflexus aggregans DSM 9485]